MLAAPVEMTAKVKGARDGPRPLHSERGGKSRSLGCAGRLGMSVDAIALRQGLTDLKIGRYVRVACGGELGVDLGLRVA